MYVLPILVGAAILIHTVHAENTMLVLHNNERIDVGVSPLIWDEKLANDAYDYVKTCKNELANTSGIGKNIAYGVPQLSTGNAFRSWTKVDNDFQKITNKDYTKMGCAAYQCTGFTMHACLYTGNPACRAICNGLSTKKLRKTCVRKCIKKKLAIMNLFPGLFND